MVLLHLTRLRGNLQVLLGVKKVENFPQSEQTAPGATHPPKLGLFQIAFHSPFSLPKRNKGLWSCPGRSAGHTLLYRDLFSWNLWEKHCFWGWQLPVRPGWSYLAWHTLVSVCTRSGFGFIQTEMVRIYCTTATFLDCLWISGTLS